MEPAKNLDSLRQRIDVIDSQLVKLLNDRAGVSVNIGLAKRKNLPDPYSFCYFTIDLVRSENVHIHIPSRELAIYEKVKKLNTGPLSGEGIQAIYREIMSASISLQKDISIAYLGPQGTYSHQAATQRFGDCVAYSEQSSISDVVDAVESGTVTYGVIPFENSSFGSVQQTLDRFISCSESVKIRAESYLQINHFLLSKSPLSSIKRVFSHVEAFGQCQDWIKKNLPADVEKVAVSSTAHAAELASKEKDTAAIASSSCATIYGLNIVASHIQDLKNNVTKFLILGNKSEGPTGDDRTLVLFTVDHRQPGALCDALNVLKTYNINLSKIDSRPSRQRSWHYYFFVELEGHTENENVDKAIKQLDQFCTEIKVLGSYRSEKPTN